MSFRIRTAVKTALIALAEQRGCSKTAVIEQAILDAETPRLELSVEAQRAIKWWAKQDGATEAEIVEEAIAFYDGQRADGGTTSSRVPSTSANTDESASIAARAAANAKAAREAQEPPVTEAAEVPGVHVGVGNLPKNAQCRHCGEKFAGPKRAIVCPDCKAAGHAEDPHGCGECFNRDGPA